VNWIDDLVTGGITAEVGGGIGWKAAVDEDTTAIFWG